MLKNRHFTQNTQNSKAKLIRLISYKQFLTTFPRCSSFTIPWHLTIPCFLANSPLSLCDWAMLVLNHSAEPLLLLK